MNNKLNYKHLNLYDNSDIFETQFIEISGSDINKPVIIGNMYRPPRDVNKNYQMFIQEIEPILKEPEKSNTESILTGDLNINLLKINDKPIFNEFLDTVISHSFYPKITLPTRLTTRRGSLLDNFYCKLSTATADMTTSILISEISDHFHYFMSLNVGKKKHIIKENDYVAIPKLSPLDIINIKKKLSEDKLFELLTNDPTADPNINYNIIDESITRTINMFSKSKPAKFNKRKHKMSNWITKGIIRSINIRNVMYRKLRKTNSDSEHYHTRKTNFRTYNVILKRSIYIAKKQYYQSCFDKYKNDMKQTWSTINTILNRNNKKRKLPENFYLNGLLTNNTKNIVNSFNEYFCNIGPK